jgi:rSAM/selenodomain-associated transferase 1
MVQLFVIFAKYWEPGRVKTRLAAAIGDRAASDLYRQFFFTLAQRFGDLAEERLVAFTPEDREDDFASLVGDRWTLTSQVGHALGERMHTLFQQAFSRGHQQVVLIGSDSPTLPRKIVENAFQSLKNHAVVLGPSADGGYYLVGASHDVPPIFERIDWGGPQVWQQTVRCLERNNIKFAQLPEWYDVDELNDLRKLNRELNDLKKTDRFWSDLSDIVQGAINSTGDRCTTA